MVGHGDGPKATGRSSKLTRLRRSLARRAGEVGPSKGQAEPPRTAANDRELPSFLRRHRDRVARRKVPVELPAGHEVATEVGTCWVRQLRYPLQDRHGGLPLDLACRADFEVLATRAKDRAIADHGLEHCLFVDTETTGLGGGAGTTVFLCGLGWIEPGAFVLEQVFLRDWPEEPGALTHIATRLKERPLLVSFVGKSFDRHRIAARMAVHRVRSPVLLAPHLDLYYLARRAWKDQLPNCRLRTVEQERLGLHREDDLPGAEAPAAWLDWLRDGCGPVDRVLEHNRLDVLSLVTLMGVLGDPDGQVE